MDPVDAPLAAEDAPRYPAPVSARRALAIVELLEVPPGGSVLDLGAGPAGLLLDVVALCACHGVGLVGSETLAAGARAVAEREGLGERIEFRATSALAFAPPRRLDAVLGLGGLGRPAESLVPRRRTLWRSGGDTSIWWTSTRGSRPSQASSDRRS